MITNIGKDIVAKFLIGQAPAYASYIAIGSGARPLTSSESFNLSAYAQKTSLDFEMFRVPISSRGYVVDIVDGVPISKVVFTAELPTEQRYEISEIGIYSAKSNPSAASKDSRMLYGFIDSENWEYHDTTTASGLGAVVATTLDANDDGAIETPSEVPHEVFRATTDNAIFNNAARKERFESCRFLNNKIFIPGNMSDITVTGSGTSEVLSTEIGTEGGNHIHYTGINVDLTRSSPEDELRLAFSVINKSADETDPERVLILLEFMSDESGTGKYAKFQVNIDGATLFKDRYQVVTKKLSELIKDPAFSWGTVSLMRMSVSVLVSGVPSDEFYVVPDAIRFENTTSLNPLYGLTGYSTIKSSEGGTLIKEANTSNLVEFRFGLSVG